MVVRKRSFDQVTSIVYSSASLRVQPYTPSSPSYEYHERVDRKGTEEEERRRLTHLVHIPQILEPSLLVHNSKINDQVPILLLSFFNHIDKFLD
jgi:hypothetical protein